MSRSRNGEAGQASVEWVALLCVLGVALAVVGVAGANPAGVVNGVVGGFQRAICVVTGTSCATERAQACTVHTGGMGGRLGVDLAVVSIGDGKYVLREERSDGTVAVSLVDRADLGAAFGVGAEGRLELGHAVRVDVEATAQVELAASLAHRRTWELPDAAAADELEGTLKRLAGEEVVRGVPLLGGLIGGAADLTGLSVDVRPPDRVGLEGGLSATAGLEVTGGSEVTAGLATTLGGSVDRRTGARTLTFRLQGEAAATLKAVVLDGPSAEREDVVGLSVDFDRDGRPTGLQVTGSGAGTGAPGLADVPVQAAGEGRVTASSAIDLDVPGHRAAYEALVRALSPSHVGELPAAVRGLAGVLAADGRQEVARYHDDRTAYGGDGSVTLGGRVGLGGEVERTSSSLRDAWARPPGGIWEQRLDCVGAHAA